MIDVSILLVIDLNNVEFLLIDKRNVLIVKNFKIVNINLVIIFKEVVKMVGNDKSGLLDIEKDWLKVL